MVIVIFADKEMPALWLKNARFCIGHDVVIQFLWATFLQQDTFPFVFLLTFLKQGILISIPMEGNGDTIEGTLAWSVCLLHLFSSGS
jgi:hypothetical protein